MAKNLTELTERTATDNADLLHINSNGTDYKETKQNFLIDLPRRFYPNTSSDLRAQIKAKVDEIGTTVSLYGIIGSYNHQTETGTPTNNNFYFEALSSGTASVKLVITIIGLSGRKWESYYASGAWGEWQEVPWLGSFNKQWSNDTLLTTQVDAIGSSVGTYFGYVQCSSEADREALGLPRATSGLIEVRQYNTNYKKMFYYPNGGIMTFVLVKSGGTWATNWRPMTNDGLGGRTEGDIISGPSGSVVKGRGTATVTITNGIAIIDFAAKITTRGTSSSTFAWGISANFLRNALSLPNLTPISRGKWMAYDGSTDLPDIANSGYGNSFTATNDGTFWCFARLYQDSGSAYGAWSDNHFPVGTYIEGTCYATI